MHKKALLILVGGRQVPNVLTAQFLKPDLIVPIASSEAMPPGQGWATVEPILATLCPNVQPAITVNEFRVQETYEACLKALNEYPDYEWYFNITCSTKIMSIGAYEAAHAFNIKHAAAKVTVWYLDSKTSQVIVPIGQPMDNQALYNISVEQYLGAYRRQMTRHWTHDPSPQEVALSRLLAEKPDAALDLQRHFVQVYRNEKSPHDSFQASAKPMTRILSEAQQLGLLTSYQTAPGTAKNKKAYKVACPDNAFAQLMETGRWLEVYTWWAAREADCFDDYYASVGIQDGGAWNELDLIGTRRAKLLIAECKSVRSIFRDKFNKEPDDRIDRNEYLYKMEAVAGLVGGKFVTRVFITSQTPNANSAMEMRNYQAFCEQARTRNIVVVTGDQLLTLPDILQKEAGDYPSYSHI